MKRISRLSSRSPSDTNETSHAQSIANWASPYNVTEASVRAFVASHLKAIAQGPGAGLFLTMPYLNPGLTSVGQSGDQGASLIAGVQANSDALNSVGKPFLANDQSLNALAEPTSIVSAANYAGAFVGQITGGTQGADLLATVAYCQSRNAVWFEIGPTTKNNMPTQLDQLVTAGWNGSSFPSGFLAGEADALSGAIGVLSGSLPPVTIGLSITEAQVLATLRTFLLQILPSGTEVVRGQANRVAMPKNPFVTMTVIGRDRLSTNVDTWVIGGGARMLSVTQSTRLDIQVDCYGATATDNVQIIMMLFRDQFGASALNFAGVTIAPLYTSAPRNLSFPSGEMQYEGPLVD